MLIIQTVGFMVLAAIVMTVVQAEVYALLQAVAYARKLEGPVFGECAGERRFFRRRVWSSVRGIPSRRGKTTEERHLAIRMIQH